MPDEPPPTIEPTREPICEKCGGALEQLTRLPKGFDHPTFDIFRCIGVAASSAGSRKRTSEAAPTSLAGAIFDLSQMGRAFRGTFCAQGSRSELGEVARPVHAGSMVASCQTARNTRRKRTASHPSRYATTAKITTPKTSENACSSLRRDGRLVSRHLPAISSSSARANANAKSRLSQPASRTPRITPRMPAPTNPNNASAIRAERDLSSAGMMQENPYFTGDPGRIRTCDLQLRRRALTHKAS